MNARCARVRSLLVKLNMAIRRAFRHSLTNEDRQALNENGFHFGAVILDPTAGGGSIPFEAARFSLTVLANDLNPVAALIEKATIEYPLKHGFAVLETFRKLGAKFVVDVRARLAGAYPDEPEADTRPDGYLWARTIRCPYCDGLIPLSPNWRLSPEGIGVRLRPLPGDGQHGIGRVCSFEIVNSAHEQSAGTIANGDGDLPFPRLWTHSGWRRHQAASTNGRYGRPIIRRSIQTPDRNAYKDGQARSRQMGAGLPCPSSRR